LETAKVFVETKSPYKLYLIQYQLASIFGNKQRRVLILLSHPG
jgi:hypothetical protein